LVPLECGENRMRTNFSEKTEKEARNRMVVATKPSYLEPPMALSVAELQPVLHDLFTEAADHLARESGFCQRARKLTGPVFAQALVFTLLRKPDATLDDFAETAAGLIDKNVTSQAFDKRFTAAAATFLHDLFLDAFNRSFNSLRAALLPVLRRFPAVFMRDATLDCLPACLAELFPGRGGRHTPHGQAAAIKLVFEAEVTTGELTDVSILRGLDNDRTAEVAGKPLPQGALLLEDMGFFSGERLQAQVEQGIYVLTRIPAWTAVFDLAGRRIDLVKVLRQCKYDSLELPVRILHGTKQQVRLLAVRVPKEQAEKRRERVRQEAKKRGRPVSQKKLDLCEWNILVSNAPEELVGVNEAWMVRRVRWQIELVFKVFKSEGQIDQTRSNRGERVLCELFAKLLGMVVQQWCLLAAGYVMLKHSAQRAARRVRDQAKGLLKGIKRPDYFVDAIVEVAKSLHLFCGIVHRHGQPSTLDHLNTLDPELELRKKLGWC
jgi:Transposase DDE domain